MYLDNETIEQAKQIDLLTYLKQHEPGNLVRLSGNNYCTREHDSLKISNGKWYWFSRGFGGRSALEYLMKVEELSFLQAVERLTGIHPEMGHDTQKTERKDQRKLLVPELNEDSSRVREYLEKRGIDPEIIEYGIRKSLIFESEEYHNAIFVGYDTGGIARYAAARSTITQYKRDLTGSDKRFSFSFSEKNGTDLHLFEAAIDLLSYATILKMEGKDWQKDDLLSLAGVFQMKRGDVLPVALSEYLKNHSEVKKIHLHLDNDEVGRGATQGIMNSLSGKYELIDEPPESGKDVNDALMNRLSTERKVQTAGFIYSKQREETER